MPRGGWARLAEYELTHPAAIAINTEGACIEEDNPERNLSPDISLPNHDTEVKHISLDIGGSLAKIVWFSEAAVGGGELHFESIETDKLTQVFDLVSHLAARPGQARVVATGGGAFKYFEDLQKLLGKNTPVERKEEIQCLIQGATFLSSQIPNEVFSYDCGEHQLRFVEPRRDRYPYLLVNIGSGVSIVKVDSPGKFQRLGGSSLGGGTLWGLLAQLTPAKTYDQMLEMAKDGDNSNVDLLVGDVYGGDYGKIGLKASAIASSFAKAFKYQDREFDPGDISRSLLYAVSNNIGQLAYLHARHWGVGDIYFAGSYIRGHTQTIHTLAYAIEFWSQGEKTAYFFRHEGFLGAVGAFLTRQD